LNYCAAEQDGDCKRWVTFGRVCRWYYIGVAQALCCVLFS